MKNTNFAKFLMTFKKVRYALLDTLLPEISEGSSLNFFIDMRYVLNFNKMEYYKEQYETQFVKNSNVAVAEFLNLIAHYKRYFTKKGCFVSFIVMTEDNDADKFVKEIYPDFPLIKNQNVSKPGFLKFLSVKLEVLCRLAPDVYVINSRDNDLAVIPIVLSNTDIVKESDFNIIMTNDPRFCDTFSFLKNPVMLKTNRDNTKVVYPDQYFWMISEENKYKLKTEDEYNISDLYVPLYEALVGFNNLPAIRRDKFKLISQLKRLSDSKTSEESDELLDELFGENLEEINRRVFIISPSAIYEKMTDSDLYSICSQLDESIPNYRELCSISSSHLQNLVEVNVLFD